MYKPILKLFCSIRVNEKSSLRLVVQYYFLFVMALVGQSSDQEAIYLLKNCFDGFRYLNLQNKFVAGLTSCFSTDIWLLVGRK